MENMIQNKRKRLLPVYAQIDKHIVMFQESHVIEAKTSQLNSHKIKIPICFY